jgi:hypothetical protein
MHLKDYNQLTQCLRYEIEIFDSAAFCERLFRASARKISKNYAAAHAFGGPDSSLYLNPVMVSYLGTETEIAGIRP